MPRLTRPVAIPSLGVLDPKAGTLGRQTAQGLRDAIARGELRPGELLPSTRTLAASLGVARGTIVEAFKQLEAEGYLISTIGSGTRVADGVDHAEAFNFPPFSPPHGGDRPALPTSAVRLAAVSAALAPQRPRPFAIAVPTGAAAPADTWRKLGNRVRAGRAAAPSGYEEPQGLPVLRRAIAEHVRKTRGVLCDAAQVIVTAGTQQGLFIAALTLLPRGEAAWAEDPAYPGLTHMLDSLGVTTYRIPVDAQGLDVTRATTAWPDARVAFVTPSHQYPLGMPLSMARRSALLAWARRAGAWVVEDDYDSELRYAGHPFPSLQGLDPDRVIYLGTFSKVLFPSLRLGYVIAPSELLPALVGARVIIDRHPPISEQHTLAAFMQEGHFEAHIRRIRGIYGERRAALVAAVAQHLEPWAWAEEGDQGMHFVLWLAPGLRDIAVAEAAALAGIVARPISPMYVGPARDGLMLGFGGFTPEELERAVQRLREVLEEELRTIPNGPS